jgi:hypothetical protein
VRSPLDVKIEIGGVSGAGGYDVVVRCPGGAEAESTMELPVPFAQLGVLLDEVKQAVFASSARHRRLVNDHERTVQKLGGILYEALVRGRVRDLLAAAREEAVRDSRGLRIVLQVRPGELARLPWEFLYNADDDEFLGLDFPLIRRPAVPRSTMPLRMDLPLRILCMVARPRELPELAIKEERERLSTALAGLTANGLVEVSWVPGEGWRDLQEALRRDTWHVFHFIGHGGFDAVEGEGALGLRGEDGRAMPLFASKLAMLLRGHPSLRLVVLNACDTGNASVDPFSSVAGALIRRDLPAVLAMQFEITDAAAVEFSRTFYGVLAERRPVDVGVIEARKAMAMAFPGTLEWGTPVLFLRSDDGHLFGPPEEPAALADSVAWNPTAATTAPPVAMPPTAVPPTAVPPTAVPPVVLPPVGVPRPDAQPSWECKELAAGREVWAVRFSPTGRHLAFAGRGREVGVVDPTDARPPLVVRHARLSDVAAVAFSPDGRWLASVGDDKTARVWDIESTAAELLRLRHHHWVHGVAFSPDGRHLATAGDDGSVRVWDARSGEPVAVLRHDGPVRALAYGSDDWLASGGDDGSVRVWELPAGECFRTLPHDGPVRAVAFAAGGRLVSGGDDGTARGWDVPGGAATYRLDHDAPVVAVAIGAASQVAAASGDRVVLWDTASGAQLRELTHQRPVYSVVFTPDHAGLVTGTATGCQLWAPPGRSR